MAKWPVLMITIQVSLSFQIEDAVVVSVAVEDDEMKRK